MKTLSNFLLICGLLLIPNLCFGLKPAPFKNQDNINHTIGDKGLTIISVRKKDDSYSTEGTTSITTEKGNVLWKVDTFIGRREYLVSPAGETLLLIGNIYFGPYKNKETGNSPQVVIYRHGQLIKTISLKDLYGDQLAKTIKDNKIRRYGGGWVATKGLIPKIDIDWSKNELNFNLINSARTYVFDWN